MPGPHRKMVTQEESATVSEGEGEGVAREEGRAEGVGAETGACGVREVGSASHGEPLRQHSRAQFAALCCQKNCGLRQVKASTPGSSASWAYLFRLISSD